MAAKKKNVGATLLELLVVMTVMMTLIGLIAGTTVDSVDRAAGQTEVIAVYNLVKKASVRAFASGNSVLLKFSGRQIEVYIGDTLRSKKTFEYLNFNSQSLRFNRNGMTDTLAIQLTVRGIDKTLDLRPLFNNAGRSGVAAGAHFVG